MSTKSYTLADGTTATVTATENGVPFNEGMQALTKAIKAKIEHTPKAIPNLSIGSWSVADSIYSAAISYDGDGALSVNVGSISNGVLTVNDDDGTFNGILSASEGDTAAPAATNFYFNTASKGKALPDELFAWFRFNDNALNPFVRTSSFFQRFGSNASLSDENAIEGTALQLNKSSSLAVRLSNVTVGETDFTVDFYGLIKSSGGTYPVFFNVAASYSDSSSSNKRFKFGAESSTANRLYCNNTGSWGSSVAITPININVRHHYALVYQKAASKMSMYVDGQLADSQTWSGVSLANPYLIIGAGAGTTTSSNFAGSIDEFRFWTKALWTEDFTPPTAQDYIDLADGISLF